RSDGSDKNNKQTMWRRTPIRGHSTVNDLNNRAFSCLIEFRNLELFGQKLEHCFLIFEIPVVPDIVHSRSRYPPFGKINIGTIVLLRSGDACELSLQSSKLLFGKNKVWVILGGK